MTLSIEQLRLLPEDDQVQTLRTRLEDQWLERTSSRCGARELGDLLVGFANAEGGLIVIGIHDRRVEGVSAGPGNRVNDWRQAAVGFTEPPVRHRFELLPCVNERGLPDQIVVIEVEGSEEVHQNSKGETFLRIGDENRRLGVTQAQELRFDKGQSVFDGRVAPDSTVDDLDEALVERYLARVRGSVRRDAVLTSRGLLAAKGKSLVPTIAGLLVLGRNPQAAFPEAFVRLLAYEGPSRDTGARANVRSDVRLEGPLPLQIDRARRRLRNWLPTSIRLQSHARFARATFIPQFAWVEAIVNAAIHRSYTIGGDHTRVELFLDRLEVESPGRLPGLVRIENIRSTRFARNPRIARAMADLGYGRELGEGVNRMFEEMERAGLPDPIFSQGPASVRVTFLADTLSARILAELPRRSERFVEHLSRMGGATTSDAVELLDVSRPTALNHLHRLARLGLIEHVGTSLKDPRGFWRLRRGAGLPGSD